MEHHETTHLLGAPPLLLPCDSLSRPLYHGIVQFDDCNSCSSSFCECLQFRRLSELPLHILKCVFEFLPSEGLFRAGMVCQSLRVASSDDRLWRLAAQRRNDDWARQIAVGRRHHQEATPELLLLIDEAKSDARWKVFLNGVERVPDPSFPDNPALPDENLREFYWKREIAYRYVTQMTKDERENPRRDPYENWCSREASWCHLLFGCLVPTVSFLLTLVAIGFLLSARLGDVGIGLGFVAFALRLFSGLSLGIFHEHCTLATLQRETLGRIVDHVSWLPDDLMKLPFPQDRRHRLQHGRKPKMLKDYIRRAFRPKGQFEIFAAPMVGALLASTSVFPLAIALVFLVRSSPLFLIVGWSCGFVVFQGLLLWWKVICRNSEIRSILYNVDFSRSYWISIVFCSLLWVPFLGLLTFVSLAEGTGVDWKTAVGVLAAILAVLAFVGCCVGAFFQCVSGCVVCNKEARCLNVWNSLDLKQLNDECCCPKEKSHGAGFCVTFLVLLCWIPFILMVIALGATLYFFEVVPSPFLLVFAGVVEILTMVFFWCAFPNSAVGVGIAGVLYCLYGQVIQRQQTTRFQFQSHFDARLKKKTNQQDYKMRLSLFVVVLPHQCALTT